MEKKTRKKSPFTAIIMIIFVSIVCISGVLLGIIYFSKNTIVEDYIEESQAEIIFKVDNKYITKQGYITTNIDNSAIELKGITVSSNQERLDKNSLEIMENLLQLRETLKYNNLLDKVNKIDVTNVEDIKIYMDSENKIINIGNFENLSTKIMYAKMIMEQEQGKKGEIIVKDNKAVFRESL